MSICARYSLRDWLSTCKKRSRRNFIFLEKSIFSKRHLLRVIAIPFLESPFHVLSAYQVWSRRNYSLISTRHKFPQHWPSVIHSKNVSSSSIWGCLLMKLFLDTEVDPSSIFFFRIWSSRRNWNIMPIVILMDWQSMNSSQKNMTHKRFR